MSNKFPSEPDATRHWGTPQDPQVQDARSNASVRSTASEVRRKESAARIAAEEARMWEEKKREIDEKMAQMKREIDEKMAQMKLTEEEKLEKESLKENALRPVKEVPAEVGANLPANELSYSVIERELEEHRAKTEQLERILKSRTKPGSVSPEAQDPDSPRLAHVSVKIKISTPDKWEGDIDRMKLENWILAARGYLNGIGIGDMDVLDESIEPLPIHHLRLLFSSKVAHGGVAPVDWFNTSQRRDPFVSISQMFDRMRSYWRDDHAGDIALDKYRSAQQGSLRAREFGSLVQVLADGCFDRRIDEDDRMATFERGLNINYREYLKTQRASIQLLGHKVRTLEELVSLAAVADGLSTFSNSLKRSINHSSSLSPSSSSGKKNDRANPSPSTSSPSVPKATGTSTDPTQWIRQALEWQTKNPESAKSTWLKPGGSKAPPYLRCFNCGVKGEHYSSSCSNGRKDPSKVIIAAISKLSLISSSPLSHSSPKSEEERSRSDSGKVGDE